MKEIFFVFIGGGVGSVIRYLIGRLVTPYINATSFLWATFIANTLGCLLIGIFAALLVKGCLSEHLRLLLIVGLCGGMTTFSTFSNESLTLLRNGEHLLFCVYMLASTAVGLVSIIIGNKIVGQ